MEEIKNMRVTALGFGRPAGAFSIFNSHKYLEMRGEKTMSLKFLIVHESTVIRDIIQKYIMREYNEAVADSSVSLESTVRMLEEKKYDIVLSGMEMTAMSGFDVRDYIRMSGANQKTPMIVMTSTDNPEQHERLARRGIQHILSIPFTSLRLKNLIHEVLHSCVPDVDTHCNIPRSKATLRTGKQKIPAEAISISRDNIVCEIVCSKEPPDLMSACQITVQFPVDYDKGLIIYVTADLDELKDKTWLEKKFSRRLSLTWQIRWKSFELATETKKTLKMVFGPSSDFWEQVEDISETNASLAEENENLREKIDDLTAEKDDLLRQASQLKKKVSEIQKAGTNVEERAERSKIRGERD